MIELPKEKRWTGDGWASNPRLLTQVKRSQHNAIYQVAEEKTGRVTGFEVFKIRILPKGTKVFDTVTVDDEEKYPTAEQFGRTAWSANSMPQAELIYKRLESGEHPTGTIENEPEPVGPVTDEPEPDVETVKRGRGRPSKGKPNIKLPKGEFKMQDVADLNGMEKANVYVIVQEFIATGKVKETRRVSTPGKRGRATVMYEEVLS